MAAPYQLYTFSELNEPAFCKVVQTFDSYSFDKLAGIQKVFESLLKSKDQLSRLHSEGKLLRIFIFKKTGQLRKEKSLQLLKRIKTCLSRIPVLEKILCQAADFNADLKSILKSGHSSSSHYVTCQQAWTYFLFLIFRSTELLEATMNYCGAAFEHLSCHLATGMLIPQMLLFMAVVGRIWMVCSTLGMKLKGAYNTLISAKEMIDRSPSDWKDPELPQKLSTEDKEFSEVLEKRKRLFADLTQSGLPREVEASLDHLPCPSGTHLSSQDMPYSSVQEEEDIGVGVMQEEEDIGVGVMQEEEDIGVGVMQDEDLGVVLCSKRKLDTDRSLNSTHKKMRLDIQQDAPKQKTKKKKKGKLDVGGPLNDLEHKMMKKKKKLKKKLAVSTTVSSERHEETKGENLADGSSIKKKKKKKKGLNKTLGQLPIDENIFKESGTDINQNMAQGEKALCLVNVEPSVSKDSACVQVSQKKKKKRKAMMLNDQSLEKEKPSQLKTKNKKKTKKLKNSGAIQNQPSKIEKPSKLMIKNKKKAKKLKNSGAIRK